MKGRTQAGPLNHLWQWLQPEVWRYWRVRRITGRSLLLVPRIKEDAESPDIRCLIGPVIDPITRKRPYILIRLKCGGCRHDTHPGTLCSDIWCLCSYDE